MWWGGRTQEPLLAMLKLEVLIRELLSIYTLPASTIAFGEVSTLNHELLDHAVEGGALVAIPFLSGSEGTEILRGLWHSLAIEPHDNPAHVFVAMLDVEVDFVRDLGAFGGFGGLGEVDEACCCDDEDGG